MTFGLVCSRRRSAQRRTRGALDRSHSGEDRQTARVRDRECMIFLPGVGGARCRHHRHRRDARRPRTVGAELRQDQIVAVRVRATQSIACRRSSVDMRAQRAVTVARRARRRVRWQSGAQAHATPGDARGRARRPFVDARRALASQIVAPRVLLVGCPIEFARQASAPAAANASVRTRLICGNDRPTSWRRWTRS